jgi:hypothetical protein
MKEQTNPFFDLANIIDVGQYKEKPVRTLQPGDTDIIQPIKRNPLYGIPADFLQAMHNLTIRNPDQMTGAEFLSQLAGIPAVAKTLDRLSGGFQLHSGSGQATQMLPETRDALLAVAPLAIKPAVQGAKAVGRGALAAAKSDAAYDLANRVAKLTGAAPLQVAPSDLARRIYDAPVSKLGRAGTTSKSGKPLTNFLDEEEIELIRESTPLFRRNNLSDLSGPKRQVLTVHDTGRTGAELSPEKAKIIRREREDELFGKGSKPIYGYPTLDPMSALKIPFEVASDERLGVHIRPDSFIPRYGRYALELHPQMRDQMTFMLNDSLDRTLGPKLATESILRSSGPTTDVAVPGSQLHDLALGYDATLRDIVARLQSQGFSTREIQKMLPGELAKMDAPETFADLLRSQGLPPIGGSSYSRFPAQVPRMLNTPADQPLLPSESYSLGDPDRLYEKLLQKTPREYIEIQMHGDVTPEHIRRIYDFGYEPSLQAEKQAKKLGIEYAFRPEAAYDIIKREKPKTLGEFFEMAEELGVAPDNERLRHSVNRMLPFGGNYAKGGKVSTNPFDHLV